MTVDGRINNISSRKIDRNLSYNPEGSGKLSNRLQQRANEGSFNRNLKKTSFIPNLYNPSQITNDIGRDVLQKNCTVGPRKKFNNLIM